MTKTTHPTILDDIVADHASVFDIRFSGTDEDCERQYHEISAGGDGWIVRKDAWRLPYLDARRKAIATSAKTIEDRYTTLGFEKRTLSGAEKPCIVYTKTAGGYVGVLSDKDLSDGRYGPSFYQFTAPAFDMYLALAKDGRQTKQSQKDSSERKYTTLGIVLFGIATGMLGSAAVYEPSVNTTLVGGLVGAVIGGVASCYASAARTAPEGSTLLATGMDALLAAQREPTVRR